MGQKYDTRLREMVARSGSRGAVPAEYEIPRSTLDSWVRRGPSEVVGLDAGFGTTVALHARIDRLEKQARVLRALLRLTLTMLRVCGVRLAHLRVADESGKRALLFAVARARQVLPLGAVLKVLHLSSSRYHEWVRAERGCDLSDHSSCPRVVAHRLTATEVLSIKTMTLATEFRHMSIRAMALHGQRLGKLFAHPNTYEILQQACGQLPSSGATVFMDSGVENINKRIDAFFEESTLDRVLAQVDLSYSNSMIEAWWRSLRHQWLYLHTLDSVAAVRRLTGFYVQQHNEVMAPCRLQRPDA